MDVPAAVHALRPGLVSVTFRRLGPAAVIRLAVDAGLEGIEWGGDVHVPPGDAAAAREVAELTREHGLAVAAYGSYFRCETDVPFGPILEAAVALGAPVIRVWAGQNGSANAGEDERRAVADRLRQVTEQAAAAGVTVAAEWHGGTLTDCAESGVKLVDEVAHENLRLYWQPSRFVDAATREDELQAVLPRLAHVHVFHWVDAGVQQPPDRRPLQGGGGDWTRYLRLAAKAEPLPGGVGRFAMLEFVPGDDPGRLPEEAKTLRALLADAAKR